MTVASTPLLTVARGRRAPMGRHLVEATAQRSPEAWVADLEQAFGQDSALHQHVPALVASRGAVDRLLTRAQRLVRR
jgi:hypothetical protein